ncbi:MAG TPA: hypothetical protein VH853_14015 [Polyangia bacterium]|jgi:hypothetical protein|nr:hypothetical protein [Polyangia bacterium]
MTKCAVGLRPAAVAVAALLLIALGAARSARAANRLVILLQAGAGSPAQRRCLTRIREELLAGGFDVEIVDPGPGADPVSVADAVTRQRGSVATIALLGDPDLGPAELWILDRIGARPEVRRIMVPRDDPDRIPEILAIRTIELLRASALSLLVESSRPAPPPPSLASPPAPAPAVSRPPPAPVDHSPERRDPIGVEAGIAVLESIDGPGAAAMPMARLRLPLPRPLLARLTFAGFGTRPRVSTSLGTADITQAFGLLEIGAVFRRQRRLNPMVTLGAGTIYVRSAGAGVYPYQGIEESRWVALIDGGVGLVARLGAHLATAIELHVSLAAPHPVIRFSGTDAATLGRPALVASWTLITWL